MKETGKERERSSSLQRVVIEDANQVYDGLNLGRRIDVVWPDEAMRSRGGRSYWKHWVPEDGMEGIVSLLLVYKSGLRFVGLEKTQYVTIKIYSRQSSHSLSYLLFSIYMLHHTTFLSPDTIIFTFTPTQVGLNFEFSISPCTLISTSILRLYIAGYLLTVNPNAVQSQRKQYCY